MSTLRTDTLQTTDSTFQVAVRDLGNASKTSSFQVANIPGLKLVDPAVTPYVTTLGYYAAGDGGSQTFYFDPSDLTTPDNGGSIIVGLNGSRWKSVINHSFNIRQFGAKGDGATNDLAAIQAAHDALPATGGEIILPNGGWWHMEGTLNLSKGGTVLRGTGFGNSSRLVWTNSFVNGINITGDSVTVRDISMAASLSGLGYAISSSGGNTYILNVYTDSWCNGVKFTNGKFLVERLDMRFLQPGLGIGILIDQGLGEAGTIKDSWWENAEGSEAAYGIHVTRSSGLQISNCWLQKMGHNLYLHPSGANIIYSVNVDNTFFDTTNGAGVEIQGQVYRTRFDNCWFSGCDAGIRIRTGSSVHGFIVGDSEFYDNTTTGFLVESGCSTDGISLDNCLFSGNLTADLAFGDFTNGFALANLQTGALSGYPASPTGLYIGTGCHNFVVSPSQFHNFTDASGDVVGKLIMPGVGYLNGSATYDPPSIAAGGFAVATVGVTGALLGDIVNASFSQNLSNVLISGYVSGTGVVTVIFRNVSGTAVDLNSGIIRVACTRLRS